MSLLTEQKLASCKGGTTLEGKVVFLFF